MTRLKAICWDFDGVLADTENAHIAAWERTFAEIGLEVSPESCSRAVEIDDRTFLADVFADRQVPNGDIDGWVMRKQRLIVPILLDSPRVYPGAADAVRRCAALGLRQCVVTTTWRANVSAVLVAAEIADRFEFVIAKEDVRSPKPDPEAYLLALKRLRLPPSAAIAFEDSPTGLRSARSAGLDVVAVGTRRPPGDWSKEARFHLADFLDPDRLDSILK